MPLGRNHIETMRDDYIDAWDAAQDSGTKKDDIATAWNTLSSDADTNKVMAQTDGKPTAEELLAAIGGEASKAATDLTNNPNDWDDNRLAIVHRHWLTLITTLVPDNVRPHHWGHGKKPI